ncbi:MAG: type II toxin-antitoxin system CcdA family antitoxin [Allosphingosinicella sp.]
MSRGSARKRPTNVSLSPHLLDEAKVLGVNVSQACERGLEEQIKATRESAWLQANRAALASSNDFVDRNGLPLARHRRF